MTDLAQRLAQLSPAQRAALERKLLAREPASQAVAALRPRAAAERAALSFAEQRLWFLDRLEPGEAYYNLPIAARLRGPLDLAALDGALAELVARHESLRTTFVERDGAPVRQVDTAGRCPLARHDLGALPEAERLAHCQEQLRAEARRPFDLATGPLFRAVLWRLGPDEHVILLAMHHIISDGWSLAVALRELALLYEARRAGAPSPLPPAELQYADFAAWQREHLSPELVERQFAYWRPLLADAPENLALPADRPRSAAPRFDGGLRSLVLSPEVSAALAAYGRAAHATPFMLLVAAYFALLARWTRQTDLCIGTVVAQRTRRELEGLLGFFANTLALRADLADDPSFAALVARVREITLGAYAHQDLPFERLVELLAPARQRTTAPLFQTALVVQNAPLEFPSGGGLRVELLPVDNGTAKYDLTFFFSEQAGQWSATVEYQAALFDPETVDRIIADYARLIEAALACPDLPLSRLETLSEADRQALLELGRGTTVVEPPATVHDLIAEQARAAPARPAVVCGPVAWTYAELDARAERVARALGRLGLGPEAPVAVAAGRSAEMVAGLWGVLRAGACYVPIDPDQPPERAELILRDTGARVVLARRDARDRLPAGEALVLVLDDLLEDDAPAAGAAAAVGVKSPGGPPRLDPAQLAYVVYTSGSTGLPKGALVEHRQIVNFLRAHRRLTGALPGDRLLQVFSPSFDGALAEVLLALSSGACLVIADRETALQADALTRLIAAEQVTLAHLTPSLLGLLDPARLPGLRTVVSVGEALPRDTVDRWAPGRRLLNGYGPTETAVGAVIGPVEAGRAERPPLGRPLENLRIDLLDPHGQPVPRGAPGEVVIAGAGVGRGYLGRPELTAERFVPDPHAADPAARRYRSGDLARWRSDGRLEYLGRIDEQVKIRGYRVEPGEVAAVLAEHPGVERVVVLPRETPAGGRQLAAYLVPRRLELSAADGPHDFEREHVGGWQALFDEMHRAALPASDPRFNISGWVSSYTGRPIEADVMRRWVDRTVERILSHRPRRVLEVGVGTGLLLFRVAPRVERYVATDFSAESLGRLRGLVEADAALAPRVALVEQTADQLAALGEGEFDLVVVNSVAQYFPSLEYFLRVVEAALGRLRPGGTLFLGDLRSYPLLGALAASIELSRAAAGTGREELLARVRRRLAEEKELCFDPMLPSLLTRRFPAIERVRVELKRGDDPDELTRFRYDVALTLRNGSTAHDGAAGEAERLDAALDGDGPRWDARGLGEAELLERLAGRLRAERPERLRIEHVANARVAADVALVRLLESERGPADAETLRTAAEAAARGAVDPERLAHAAEQLGYAVRLGWSGSGGDGTFDAALVRCDAAEVSLAAAPLGESIAVVEPAPAAKLDARALRRYANHPLAGIAARRLLPELRDRVRRKLPDYMHPAAYVVLDELPLSASGKLNVRALPAPELERPEWSGPYVAPRGETEARLAGVWEQLLGIRPISMTDGFFDLGGHSMLAVRLMAEVEREFGRRLPLAALFETPTIEHLAGLLERAESGEPAGHLVTLEAAGEGPPWYFVHPAGGTVFCYRELARRLRGPRPVCALQARGIDGLETPHTSVEAMAEAYVAALRARQPAGPYYLGGWSLGGNVAFEMARQLTEAGETVARLALLDAGLAPPDRALTEQDFLPLLLGLFPAEDQLPLDALQALPPQEQLDYFIARAGRALLVDREAAEQHFQAVFRVFQANVKAVLEYRPRLYRGTLTLLRAREQAVDLGSDPELGWGPWAERVEVISIPTDHVHMIREPAVALVAAALGAA